MALSNVRSPYSYYADPNIGRPIFNGSIYIGIEDTDPLVKANQLPLFAIQENGSSVSIPQPVKTNSGGLTVDNDGNLIILQVSSLYDGFSMTVLNKQGGVEYSVPDTGSISGGSGGGGSGYIRVEDFGGGTSNTAEENCKALSDALNFAGGRMVVFDGGGAQDAIYLMSSCETTTFSANVRINPNVTIKGEGEIADYLMLINCTSCFFSGGGFIDSNDLFSQGVFIRNESGAKGSGGIVNVEDINISNCKQHHISTNPPPAISTTNAAGLRVRGDFKIVRAVSGSSTRIWSDAPAVSSGGSGNDACRGVLIDYSRTSGEVAQVGIVDSWTVDNLFPANDADGAFMQQPPWVYDKTITFIVNECKFINCEKRAIKSQVGITKATKNHIIRSRKVTLDSIALDGTFGTDIDFQYGGGYADGNSFTYTSGYFCPKSVYGVLAQAAFADPETGEVDPLWDIDDGANFIENTSITVDDDLLGVGFRLFTATSRYTASQDKLKQFNSASFKNISLNKKFDTLGLLFGVPTVSTTDLTFKNISFTDISCEGFNQNYLISATEDTNQPEGATTYGANLEFNNIKAPSGSKVFEPFIEAVTDNGDSINVVLGEVRDDTFILGKTSHKVYGRALNSDVKSFDIVNTPNDVVKVTVKFTRASNNTTQVRHEQVFTFIDSSSSGRRQLNEETIYSDEQAGQWSISGSFNRVNSFGQHVTRLNKLAGTDTDGNGASRGWWSVEVESSSATLVYESSEDEGDLPPVIELKDSTLYSGSNYYHVFESVRKRQVSSTLLLTQVGNDREYIFTDTASAFLPPTEKLRVGDTVSFEVLSSFTGTVNVKDVTDEIIRYTDNLGSTTTDTNLEIDTPGYIWSLTYVGSKIWEART